MTPSPGFPSLPARATAWLRMGGALLALMLFILVPFALWGDTLAQAAPAWLQAPDSLAWLALLGIALLVADVVLPIPSSVVGMALCWTLGPLWGGASMALGLTLSFALGYALGRLLPEYRLRQWVGAPLWDRVRTSAGRRATWWIVAARPLPLLAEMSALLAGVWRVPPARALLMAALSSCGVAALYAASAWLGRNAPGLGLTLAATLALPALTWGVHRLVVRRISTLALSLLVAGGALAVHPLPAMAQNTGSLAADEGASALHTYYTGGVHNDKGCKPPSRCIYPRKPGEPTQPLFPKWWTSEWTMYRVFNNYDKYPPPYSSPPEGLTPADYQVSYGASYYDSTYVPPDKDGYGAMMEHYDKFCLPIFPSANNYTCSFISLGNKAYFLRYEDRPQGTPQCCQFSLHNHPPRRDFIKHLPYNAKQSTHLGGSIQAYSREVGKQKILFGYAFHKTATPDDPANPKAPKYRHPQSFFFSGYPASPPDAPIVSQNYTHFRAERPDPGKTWDQVARMCKPNPGWCCLFATDCPTGGGVATQAPTPASMSTPAPATWADMNSPARQSAGGNRP
ncbi:MAG: TVP38/TMEM64 family protein [Ramlibacter sp.]